MLEIGKHINSIIVGDSLSVLKTMPDCCIDCVITSPPYFGLRDYGTEGQIGLEDNPEDYVGKLVGIFHEIKRVLKDCGTLWLNLGDTWNGSKTGNTENVKHKKVNETMSFKKSLWSGAKRKDLIGIPWMTAFALRDDGWYLRNDIIWERPNAFPKTNPDRFSPSHEHIFLLSKNQTYYFDTEKSYEPTIDGVERRRMRDVWSVNTCGGNGSHVAPFPEKLIEPMVLCGCPEGGIVMDPFIGSGTTGVVALRNGRNYIGIELNENYAHEAGERIGNVMDEIIYKDNSPLGF